HRMDALKIDTVDIGLPGAGPHVARDVERLARAIAADKLHIQANCAARTMVADIKPIAEIVERTGVPIECCAFIGSTPIRQYADGWGLDLLLVNLVMMGYRDQDLTSLLAYCETVARACEVRIAPNYPVIGADAFRTATGVHAAAVVKAFRKGDRALMDAVYAAVPASLVGREQEIEIGPMSGRSNVIFWLERRGLPATDDVVDRVFAAAKASNRTLSRDQVQSIVDEARRLTTKS